MTPHSDSVPPDDSELDSALLERYWFGETSPEETAALDAWFAARPGWKRRYDRLQRGIAKETVAGLPADRVDRMVAQTLRVIKERREADSSQPLHPGAEIHKTRIAPPSAANQWSRILGIGFAFLLILGGSWGIWQNRHATQSGIDRLLAHPSVYTTASGQRATIKLSDETVVTLNVGSRLEIPADYAMGNRQVRLQGEALFTVQHRTGTPFTVVAGPSTTRVLGTSFVVRHFTTDRSAMIAVREGKVAVSGVVVTAAQRVEVTANGVGAVRPLDENLFTFERGILNVERKPLRNAIEELNRWYDADIRVADSSLADAIIEGQFSEGSVLELIEQLTSGLNVKIVRNGKMLTLYRRGA